MIPGLRTQAGGSDLSARQSPAKPTRDGQSLLYFQTMSGRTLFLTLIVSAGLAWGQQYARVGELIETGDLQAAQEVVERGLAAAPRHPELLYWRSVLYLKQGRTERALTILSGLETEGRALPPHRLLLGQIYESQEKWAEAAATYRDLLAQATFPRARWGLAYSEFKQRRYAAAIEALEPMATDSASADVIHLLGLAYFGKGDLPKAAEYLGRAVALAPDQARYHFDLGLARLQGKLLQAAARAFRRASELQPDWPQAWLYLGRSLHDLNRGDEARSAFAKAESLDPDLPLLQYHFGMLEKGRGNFESAIEHFEEELRRGSDYPPCRFHLAELLSRRGRRERARELAEQAVRLDPDNAEYRLLAARLALDENQTIIAEAHLNVALKVAPDSGPGHYLKGRLLQAQGKHDEAAAAFAEARRLSDLKSHRTGRP